jgi:hypothetical protein
MRWIEGQSMILSALLTVSRWSHRVASTIHDLAWVYRQRAKWDHLVLHRRQLTKLPAAWVVPFFCRDLRGCLQCPPELTILLIHNYATEPVMEKSLRFVGIDNYVVLRPEVKGPWHNSAKIVVLDEFLARGACRTEYVLFCDSDDAVLVGDPAKAIPYLQEEACDLLVSCTSYTGGYTCMPQIKQWADQNARASGYQNRYMNTGVYIAKTDFLRELVRSAKAYVTPEDLSRVEYRRARRNGSLDQRLPEFPRGVGCDQVIFRYLHPRFYPRMKIDYAGRLALR